jgi:hypothetical protein
MFPPVDGETPASLLKRRLLRCAAIRLGALNFGNEAAARMQE